jgi:hypothetical protein
MRKLIVAFHNFVNTSKKYDPVPHVQTDREI